MSKSTLDRYNQLLFRKYILKYQIKTILLTYFF